MRLLGSDFNVEMFKDTPDDHIGKISNKYWGGTRSPSTRATIDGPMSNDGERTKQPTTITPDDNQATTASTRVGGDDTSATSPNARPPGENGRSR